MRLGATLAAAALGGRRRGSGRDPRRRLGAVGSVCVRTVLSPRPARPACLQPRGRCDRRRFDRSARHGVRPGDRRCARRTQPRDGRRPAGRRILVLRRESQSQGRRALERFAAARPVEEGVARGQEDLVDVKPDAAKIPHASLAAVASWLGETLAGEPVAVSVPRRDEAVVGHGDARPDRRAHPLARAPRSLRHRDRAPSDEDGRHRPGGPTAVFLNAGTIDHTGPARQCVDAVPPLGCARPALAALRPERARRQPGPARSGGRRVVSSGGARGRARDRCSGLTRRSVRRRAGRALFGRLSRH